MSKIAGIIVGVLAVSLLVSLLLSYPLMLLWNGCLVPALPGIAEVSWLQMWGIAILIKLLFQSGVEAKAST